MKRLVIILLIISLCAPLLTSCNESHDSGKLSIIATVFPQYDFVRQIIRGAEDSVSLRMMLPPGSESHDYEASLGDLSTVGNADLIICVGGETDAWIDTVIDGSGSKATVLRLTDMVPLLREDTEGIFEDSHDHEHSHEHSHDHGEHGEACDADHGEYDEHVWTSPENAALMTERISEALCALMPEQRELFRENTKHYVDELTAIQRNMEKTVLESELDTLIFADRFPFRYLTESLGLHHLAAFSGCSSDTEPALSTIYRLTEKAKEISAPVILTAEFSNGYSASVIASETGTVVRTLHSCHNVSREDFSDGVTYSALMEKNLEVLKEALTPRS